MTKKLSITQLVGKRIKELRTRVSSQMTTDELGKKIDVRSGTIAKWESGFQFPRAEYIEQLATIFGVPWSFFFRTDEEEMEGAAQRDSVVAKLLDTLREMNKENRELKKMIQAPIDTSAIFASNDRDRKEMAEEILRLKEASKLIPHLEKEDLKIVFELITKIPKNFLSELPHATDQEIMTMMLVAPRIFPDAKVTMERSGPHLTFAGKANKDPR